VLIFSLEASMSLTRRLFLTAAGAGAVLAGLGAYRALSYPREDYVKIIVRNRLPYLTYEDAVLEEFARDFVALVPAMSATRGYAVAFVGMRSGRLLGRMAGTSTALQIEMFEEKVASEFLKATDFFDNGEDVSTPLSYVAFGDPYFNACRNPLAVLM